MDYEFRNGTRLRGLGGRNVILGKNGCGKSYLLKLVEEDFLVRDTVGLVRYVSPERAGQLVFQPTIEQNLLQNANWISGERRRNQAAQFKQQSFHMFRRLELNILRTIEHEHTNIGYVPGTFDAVIDKINSLLDRVMLVRSDSGFKVQDRISGAETHVEQISSGESELVALAIECLAFSRDADPNKENFLLIDEPDVHLHPDLQDRLARFMAQELEGEHVKLILATHSTALLASLARNAATSVAFMVRGDTELLFRDVTDIHKRVLPMFGAHPLSNLFNEAPVLLVEGEDDERVWQQAMRSSQGRLSIFPCVTDSVHRVGEFETEVNEVIASVYDNARAFSLRDRDAGPEAIDDLEHVCRMRLSCRAAENLMLSDEVLARCGTDWSAMQQKILAFAATNVDHPYREQLDAFIVGGLDRKSGELKKIRNILAGLMTNKPWEVVVGQAIGDAVGRDDSGPGTLRDFLGPKVCRALLSSVSTSASSSNSQSTGSAQPGNRMNHSV